MRLAELLTYVVGWVRIVEVVDDDEVRELFLGRHNDVPKELLRREISFVSGSQKGYVRICLVRE